MKKRFVITYKEGSMGSSTKILSDLETGISYLVYASGYGVAVTPLLGRDGKPVSGPIDDLEQ